MGSVIFEQDAGSRAYIGQLIYRSVSVVSARGALEISDILEEARENNRQRQLTGVLTVVDGQFIQILEGPDGELDALLAILQDDPRHRDMVVLERRQVDGRVFEDWTMVSPRLSPTCSGTVKQMLHAGETRLDAYMPILKSALEAQDRLATEWHNPRRSGEQA